MDTGRRDLRCGSVVIVEEPMSDLTRYRYDPDSQAVGGMVLDSTLQDIADAPRIIIDAYGYEGEPMDRFFTADGAGEVWTDRLKEGTYAIVKVND